MKNIITIQHVQSEQHTNGMIGSWTDWGLTALGKEHAENIGRNLSAELKGQMWKMYSSDLLRARETAKPLARFIGLEPIFTEALREINLGEACGKSKAWAQERNKTPGFISWDMDNKAFEGAESKRDLLRRLQDFHEQIMAVPEENLILVSHSFTLDIYLAMWLGLDMTVCGFHGSAGGVSFIHEDADGKHFMHRLNDKSYMTI